MNVNMPIRHFAVGALACLGVLGPMASAALATGSPVPAAGIDIPIGTLPPPGAGGPVAADCPSSLSSAHADFLFSSGNAVFYGPATNPATHGGNVEGIATLNVGGTAKYTGQAHFWFGFNVNPTGNGQNYNGITVSFHGTSTGADGGSITINGSFGSGTAANPAGNEDGWGHLKVTC